MDIELLLAHADDQRPVLSQGLPPDAVAAAPAPAAAPRSSASFRDDSADPNALDVQRWGVLAPEGAAGDRLLALIEPLIRARRAQQGDAPVRVYRAPPSMNARAADAWKRDVYWDEDVPEDDIPRYLLVLGDLDGVSLDLQQRLASDVFVGRLTFPGDAGYEAYVDKVLRWERSPSEEARARALFYTVHDGTEATTVGYASLMSPTLARCRERMDKGALPAGELVEVGGHEPATVDTLLEEAARPGPGVLFSMSHGLGAPRGGWRSAADQRALQGAMSLGGGERFAAKDMEGRRFLPGGVWFMLSCYGAGTPSESAYVHWLAKLREAGELSGRVDAVLAGLPGPGAQPFIAALPQVALENPEGPLAVLGHVDLAWTFSFQDAAPAGGAPSGRAAGGRDRPSRFQGVFRSLLQHARAGVACHELLRFFSETSVTLAACYEEEARAQHRGRPLRDDASRWSRKANLWMLRNDLAGYVLLGDPAVRLPLREGP